MIRDHAELSINWEKKAFLLGQQRLDHGLSTNEFNPSHLPRANKFLLVMWTSTGTSMDLIGSIVIEIF